MVCGFLLLEALLTWCTARFDHFVQYKVESNILVNPRCVQRTVILFVEKLLLSVAI